MALTRTQRIASTSASGFGAGAYTSASFTPSNNSLLVVIGFAMEQADNGLEGTSLTITDSAGLTWTSRAATTTSPAWSYGIRIWTAPVTTGVSMTVSIDAGASSIEFYKLHISDYTSNTTSAIPGTGTIVGSDADGDGAATITLSSAPATSSEVIAACLTGLASTSGTVTPGAGWTEVDEQVGASWGIFQVQVRTGSTSTAVDWADVLATGTGFGGATLAAFEIAETAGAAPDDITSVYTDPNEIILGDVSEFSFLFENPLLPPSTDTPITSCFSLGYY